MHAGGWTCPDCGIQGILVSLTEHAPMCPAIEHKTKVFMLPMRTTCPACTVLYLGPPPPVCGCGYILRPWKVSLIQDTFFTDAELRGPGMKRWSVQWRWKPRVWKAMVADEPSQNFAIMLTLGNTWKTHDVERTLPTMTMARHAVDSLRRRFPGKSFRIVQVR